MPTFEHDGIQFHYEDHGAGLPFVFQHGLGSDRTHPAGVFRGRPGIRLVTLENRGHGLTWPIGNPSGYTFNQFAEDVLALMTHLECSPFVAGGISMGAGIGLNLAIRHPERIKGLVLIRPAWLENPMLWGDVRVLPLTLFVPLLSLFLRLAGSLAGSIFIMTDLYTAMQGATSIISGHVFYLFFEMFVFFCVHDLFDPDNRFKKICVRDVQWGNP